RGALQPHRLGEFAAARELGLVVAELDPALDQVEEGRGEGDVAFRRVAVGDRAHVRVHAEDLLHHHDAAARGPQRVGTPRADLARGGVQCDVASHAPRPPFSPPFQPSLQYAVASPPADSSRCPPPPKSDSSASAAPRRWSTPSASSPSCGSRATSWCPATRPRTWWWSTPAASSTPRWPSRWTRSARRWPRTAR